MTYRKLARLTRRLLRGRDVPKAKKKVAEQIKTCVELAERALYEELMRGR